MIHWNINNYNFSSECQVLDNTLNANLSILFIVRPLQAEQNNIIMPYFIAVLDKQKNIIDIQYYNVLGNLNKNIETASYIETEITDIQKINIPYKDEYTGFKNTILIGFMLDDLKLKILN